MLGAGPVRLPSRLGGVDKGASRCRAEVIQGCLLGEGGGAARLADG